MTSPPTPDTSGYPLFLPTAGSRPCSRRGALSTFTARSFAITASFTVSRTWPREKAGHTGSTHQGLRLATTDQPRSTSGFARTSRYHPVCGSSEEEPLVPHRVAATIGLLDRTYDLNATTPQPVPA